MKHFQMKFITAAMTLRELRQKLNFVVGDKCHVKTAPKRKLLKTNTVQVYIS